MSPCLSVPPSLPCWPRPTLSDLPSGHVSALFEAQVLRHPEHIAIHDLATRTRLSYYELHQRVLHLSQVLTKTGCQPGEIVGVCLPHSPEAIIALLAILQLGAAYLPLDPHSSPSRSLFWLNQVRSRLVVTSSSWRAASVVEASHEVVCLDQLDLHAEARGEPVPDYQNDNTGEALACVLSTVGTTGLSKGVCLSHRSLLHQALGSETTCVQPTDRVGHVMPLFSYPSLWEIWATLLAGATLVIVPPDQLQSPLLLAHALHKGCVTRMYLPSALFQRLVKTAPSALARIETLLVGGDTVASHTVRTILQQHRQLRLLHVYGQAEAGGFSLSYEVSQPEELVTPIVPLGRPLSGITARIFSETRQPITEVDQTGELLLAGPGLAKEYLGAPVLSETTFGVASPAGYRSGDLVRWKQAANGERLLSFVGRRSLSAGLSLHGFPLSELEAVLSSHPALLEVALIASGTAEEPCLSVFLVPQPTAHLQVQQWQERFQEQFGQRLIRYLPRLRLPVAVYVRETLPLTSTGLLDRQRLRQEWVAPTSFEPPAHLVHHLLEAPHEV